MQFHGAATAKIITRSVAMAACLTAMLLGETVLGAASVDAPVADADAAVVASAADASPAAAKPFNPAAMPEVAPAKAPLGYHYAELTPSQTSALRRGFKLPLDALSSAKSPADLNHAVVLAPLPDPNRPLLAVSPTGESLANPFADSEAISFRKDPLKALGALLGASNAQPAGSKGPSSASTSTTASGAATGAAADDDPFGSESVAPTATPAAEVEGGDDPFGAGSDPFGGDTASDSAPEASEESAVEEDPFGDF